jgi:hypothetical protein
MCRKSTQIQPIDKSPLLDLLQRGIAFICHLAMQNLNTVKAPLGRQIQTQKDVPQFVTIELPEGVGRHGKSSASGRWRRCGNFCRQPRNQSGDTPVCQALRHE